MSDTVDLTLLSNLVHGVDREVRLLRLQVDVIASRLAAMEPRLTALEPRFAAAEQSFHGLVAEVARVFGQVRQQMMRQEKRIDVVDAGLSTLRTELADSTARILHAIGPRA
jgi:uncharacterized coiled-coil protein SlyX